MTLSAVIWVIGKCAHDGCPRWLTEEHKKQHIACALTFLMCYHKEGDGMLSHIDRRQDMGVPHHT